MAKPEITVVGGGLAGLTAAITAAEQGAAVQLLEGHELLGGRARSTTGPYKANLGPHVVYKDGPFHAWLAEREMLPQIAGLPLAPMRFRHDGRIARTPPLTLLPPVLRLRGREAPVDRDFRSWAESHAGAEAARFLSNAAGVYTFHHDPGELSAAFIWQRTVRVLLTAPPAARWVVGGWNALVATLEARALKLGVEIVRGERVTALPGGVVVVATELRDARALLADDDGGLAWNSGTTVCLDLGLTSRRGDPFVVSDLDEAGWIERFSAPDPSVAPKGEELLQAQMPVRPGESVDDAVTRLETLLDQSYADWRARVTWRRRQLMDGRSGALDMPGTTWRDRPAIDRGDGVFLAGDCTAAPGLLGEVAWASGVDAATRAVKAAALAGRGVLRKVA